MSSPIRLTGRIRGGTELDGYVVDVAQVSANSVQASTGRWIHWVRLEFSDPSHAHYSYSGFESFPDVRDWVESYCCSAAAHHGCTSLHVDWEGDPALEVVA